MMKISEKHEVIKVCKAIVEIRNEERLKMIEAMKANGASEEFIQATLKTLQENAEK